MKNNKLDDEKDNKNYNEEMQNKLTNEVDKRKIKSVGKKLVRPHATKSKCFPAFIEIIMADKSLKPINTIKKGDEVLSFNYGNKTISTSKVKQVIRGTVNVIICINNIIHCSPNQTIFTNRGILDLDELKIGDSIYQFPDLDAVKILSIEKIQKKCEVFNLVVKPHCTFFANRCLVEDQVGISCLVNCEL